MSEARFVYTHESGNPIYGEWAPVTQHRDIFPNEKYKARLSHVEFKDVHNNPGRKTLNSALENLTSLLDGNHRDNTAEIVEHWLAKWGFQTEEDKNGNWRTRR